MTASPLMSADMVRLGDILEEDCFQNGLYKPVECYGSGTPILRINDFDNDGQLRTKEFARVVVSRHEYGQWCVEERDILVNRVNSLSHIGKCVLIPTMQEYPLFESNMMRIRIKSDSSLVPEYVALTLQQRNSRKYFRKVAKPAVAQASINQDDVRSLRVFVCSIQAQKWIAAAIALWDTAIEKTDHLVAAKQRRHLALLIRLLGKRLWEASNHARADALFKAVSARNRPDLPVLAVTQDHGVVPRSVLDRRIAMEHSDPATFKIVRQGDFVISLRSFQGGLEYSAYEGLVSPAYTVLRCGPELDPRFCRHYLKSPDFLKRLAVAVVGIRDGKQISYADFASIRLPVPDKQRQARITAVLDESEYELGLLKLQADQLRLQKRGLMQKLLTGEWRVPLADAEPA